MKARTKARVKNTILSIITIMAFVYWVASAEVLLDGSWKSLAIFIATSAWLVLFGIANSKEE